MLPSDRNIFKMKRACDEESKRMRCLQYWNFKLAELQNDALLIHSLASAFVAMFMASIPRIAIQPQKATSIISISSIPFFCIRARKEERIDSSAMELDV
jgi:hypothetical protein